MGSKQTKREPEVEISEDEKVRLLKERDEVDKLREKIESNHFRIESAVFGGGGAKVMAYVGVAEVFMSPCTLLLIN